MWLIITVNWLPLTNSKFGSRLTFNLKKYVSSVSNSDSHIFQKRHVNPILIDLCLISARLALKVQRYLSTRLHNLSVLMMLFKHFDEWIKHQNAR